MSAHDPRFDLESALIDLGSVASAMWTFAESDIDREHLMSALSYLANQIEDHTDSASNAFNEIFGLDEFSEQQGGPGPLVWSLAVADAP